MRLQPPSLYSREMAISIQASTRLPFCQLPLILLSYQVCKGPERGSLENPRQ